MLDSSVLIVLCALNPSVSKELSLLCLRINHDGSFALHKCTRLYAALVQNLLSTKVLFVPVRNFASKVSLGLGEKCLQLESSHFFFLI